MSKKTLCPYCHIRPRIDITCGRPVCQIKRNREINRKWYRRYHREMGEGYRAGWRAHSS